MLIAAPVSAQVSATWDGDSGVDLFWLTGDNWIGGAAPGAAGDSATFDNPGVALAVDMNGQSITVDDMFISAAASGYDINNGTLTLSTLAHSASGSNTISAILGGTITGSVSAGTLKLTNAANIFGGTIIVDAGATLDAYAGSLGSAAIGLDGGTATLSLGGANPLPTAGIAYMQITNDADSQISTDKTYTHALDFGNSGAATVNGVAFASDVNLSAGGRTNPGTRTYGGSFAGNAPPGVSGNVASVFTDLRYNGPDLGYIELTGLTDGQWYDVRLYDRSYGYNVNNRTYYAQYDVGGDGSVEFTTPKIDQNRAHLAPMNMPGDVSWAMSYVYQADANGKIKVIIDLADDTNGTYHLYGLTNEEAGGGPLVSGDLDMSGNDIVVTAGSTLQAITDGAATFGGLTLTSGTLAIEGAAGGTTFASLAAIAPGAAVGITSDSDVTINSAVTLGAGASLALSGETFTVGNVTMSGSSGTIALASSLQAGALELSAGTFDFSGTQNYDSLTTTGTPVTMNFNGGGTLTTDAFDDQSSGARIVNLTGSGTLAIDGSVGGTVAAADTTFSIGGGTTLSAAPATAGPMGAGGTTLSFDGGTFKTSGEVLDTTVPGTIMQSIFYNTGADSVMDMTGATYSHATDRTLTGTKPNTVLSLDDDYSELGDSEISGWNSFDGWSPATPGVSDQFATVFSGQFVPDTTGVYGFKMNVDDREWMWIDMDHNGVFEAGEALGAVNNQNKNNKTLDAGVPYDFIAIGRDNGGNQTFNWYITKPGGAEIRVNPTNSAGSGGVWQTGAKTVEPISMTDTDFVVTANSNLIATTDSTAEFDSLSLNGGTLGITGVAVNTTFSGTTVAPGAVTGVTSTSGLTLGALTVGTAADVTVGSPSATATSIDVDTSVIIRTTGAFDPGTYNEGAAATSLVKAGSGSLDLRNLGDGAAEGTIFTAAGGTLQLGGDHPLGGSTAPLNLAGGTIQVTGAEVAAPAPVGAIAHYSFDDVAGSTVPDSSGSATTYDGTITGGATVVAGHKGTGAMDFNGSDSYIGLGAGINPLDGESAFTLAWWSNMDSSQNGAQISSDSNAGARFIIQDAEPVAPVYAQGDVFGGAPRQRFTSDGQWHHYALTVSNTGGGDWKFYVDGDEEASTTHNFTMSNFEFQMGKHVTIYFDGMMDDVYVYDSALNDTQIGALYGGIVTDAIDLSGTDVIVTDNSGLDMVTPSTATLGSLTFGAPGVLTTSGADGGVIFADTALVSGDNGFETLADTSPGPITVGAGVNATIVKTGAGDLILEAAAPTIDPTGSLAFDVQGGALVAQAGSNPLGDDSPISINGGEVVLISSATPVAFDNPVASTGGALTAGRDGDGHAATVTIGSASNHVTLTSGALTMQTLDGYTLNVGGNVLGSGDLTIGAASTVTVAGTLDAGTVTIDGSLSVAGTVNVNELIANTGGTYSGPSNLTVTQTLTLNGDLNLSAATLVADGADVTVNGGTLTLQAGNSLGGGTPVASVDVSRGGGLALSGNSLTTRKLSTTGGTFDMGATGSFIATGDVTASPAAGPAQLQLTGGVLSIEGAGAEMPGGLQFHIDASDINNDGGATNPANGATVTNWADISGNGNDADNPWNAPVYNTAGPNGRPVVTFTDDILSTTHNFNSLAGYTMITVARYTGGDNERVFGSMDRNFLFGFHGATTSDWHADSWIYNGGGSADTDFHLHVGTITNDADPKASFWDNGVNRVTDNIGSHNTNYRMDRLALGGYRVNSETSNADIAEALIFEGVLNADDINNIAGYLASKYGLAGTGYDGALSGPMNLTGTNLLMTTETTINVISDVTLGALHVTNDDAPTLTFTGDADLSINLESTTLDNSFDPLYLTIDNTPKVNLGALNLGATTDPEIEKYGPGQWIVTDTIGGYTGGVATYILEGALVLGDPGAIGPAGSIVDMDSGTALKLSSSGGDKTYDPAVTEEFIFTGDTTILAGKADGNSAATATITLPTVPSIASRAVTLGTTDDTYTLKIDGAVTADSLTFTGPGTVMLAAGGTVNTATVDTGGTVNVPGTLTVTDRLILGAVEVTDDENIEIDGSNLADPTGTLTISGGAFTMGPSVVPLAAPSGAVAHYEFDSLTAGVAPNVGSAGAALDGTLVGDAALTVGGGGMRGEAMNFDGNGDYINVAYDAALDMSEFTVSAWVKISSEPTNYGILGTRIGGDATFDVKVRATDIHADVGSGGGWISTGVDIGAGHTGSNGQGGDLAVGQWYQVTYVVDDPNKQFKLYIDGDLKRTIAYGGTPRFMKPGQSLWIGDDYAGHEYMNGLIDEVFIYDRALDGGEVVDLFDYAGPAVIGTVEIDMPNLAIDLATPGTSAAITLRDTSPTLGDLTMGGVTDLTIAVAQTTSFNNVTVNAGGPATINNAGATPGLTVRGALQTATGGGDLTTNFSVNGNLTVADMNAVGTLGAPITVSAKNFTGTGAVTFNEHATLALTSSTLAVTGGITTFAPDSGATGADAIIVGSGASLVVETAGISTDLLNVPQDATLNASSALAVTSFADLGSLDITASGAAFTLSGSDLSDDSTARTVTLQGDTVTFSGAAASGAGAAGMAYIPITNDADSEIDPGKTYTHKIDFGSGTVATVNTVAFDNDFSGNGSFVGTGRHGGNNPPVTGAVADVFRDMNFNNMNGEIILTGLTPGTWYDVRMYHRSWGNGGTRTQTFLYDVSNDGSTEETVTLNTDDASAVPPGLAAWNTAYAMSYTYQAEANGTLNIHANAHVTNNTLHLYGLTNEEVVVTTGGISIPNTTVVAASNSTLVLSAGDTNLVTVGGIEASAGATLTIDSPATTIALTNLTLGDGSMVKSTAAAGATVDITVSGKLSTGSGTSNVGDPGDEFGFGADTYLTNLTLIDGAVPVDADVEWTLTSGAQSDVDGGGMMVAIDDSLHVYGTLNMADGLTIQLVDGLAPGVNFSGVDVALFKVSDMVIIDGVVGSAWEPADVAKITVLSPVGAPVEWTWDSLAYLNDEFVVLTNLVTGVQPGDANGDNKVNEEDLALLNAQWGDRGAGLSCDFDGDGDVDVDDFQILNAQWGYDGTGGGGAPAMPGSETPEPATMSLLALGGLLILRRRRKA
jgi:hypothetical protein